MMPMPPPTEDEELMDMPPDMEGDADEFDTEAALAELQDAEAAGEEYAGKSFFAPVPGAEGEGGELKVEAEGEVTPEQLQELLAQLQQQG